MPRCSYSQWSEERAKAKKRIQPRFPWAIPGWVALTLSVAVLGLMVFVVLGAANVSGLYFSDLWGRALLAFPPLLMLAIVVNIAVGIRGRRNRRLGIIVGLCLLIPGLFVVIDFIGG